MMTTQKNKIKPEDCASRLAAVGDALYAVGGKWKLRIIIALSEGNRRFNDLQRSVQGISARVLSHELKELELNGFITRTVFPETPVIIEYQLTPYSDSLDGVLKALSDWGLMHRARIKSGDLQ
jgi:DNA-binding HxlR family transcriptional regulator